MAIANLRNPVTSKSGKTRVFPTPTLFLERNAVGYKSNGFFLATIHCMGIYSHQEKA
jgi:hypothetical protein